MNAEALALLEKEAAAWDRIESLFQDVSELRRQRGQDDAAAMLKRRANDAALNCYSLRETVRENRRAK